MISIQIAALSIAFGAFTTGVNAANKSSCVRQNGDATKYPVNGYSADMMTAALMNVTRCQAVSAFKRATTGQNAPAMNFRPNP